jgi:hypothetical protein
MASIIENMAANIKNFVIEKYNYPPSNDSYYQAVSWSGLTHLASTGELNPLFEENFPNEDDRENIIKIFNTENGTASYADYNPLIDNNCN